MRPFVGREKALALFDQTLTDFDRQSPTVLVYHGVAGIGKSRLRKELGRRLSASDKDYVWATLDFKLPVNREPDHALFLLRNDFHRGRKLRFPSFDIAYAVFWEKTHPQIALTKAQLPFLEEGDLLAEVISALKDVPGIGLVTKLPRAWMRLSDTAKTWWTKRGSVDLRALSEAEACDVFELLQVFWAADMQSALRERPGVIFIDTYEALWGKEWSEATRFASDAWVRKLVLQLPEVLWVITGRQKVDWKVAEPKLRESIHHFRLKELKVGDSKKYLRACGIYDEETSTLCVNESETLTP